MTDRYFDSVNGRDSNDGLTSLTPKQSYDAYIQTSGSGGDRYFLRRGVPHIISTQNTGVRAGPGDTQRTLLAAYGEAQVPYAIIQNPSAVGNMILNISGRSYIDFEDLYLDGMGVCQYSLYMFASGATANVGHRVARCFFTRMKSGEAGLVVGGTATSTGDVSNILVEDSHFFRNPGHGMLVNGANGVIVRRSKFHENGFDAPFGAHGFSAKFRRTDATSGWTNTSGTIWQRTLAAYETNVYYVKSMVSPYQRLNLTAGTQTAPAAGEFGVSAGVLYINLGSASNPSGQGINYAWGRCYNLTIEDNESYKNFSDSRAPSTEGHGFAFDDYTEQSVFRRNESHHNEGAAFSINKGDDNIIESNLGHDNQLPGLVLATGWRAKIRHNTFIDNNQSGEYASDIAIFTYAKDGEINNNILQGMSANGVNIDSTCTGFSGSKNNVVGYAAAENGSVLTGTITDDPLLDGMYRPTIASVKTGGAFLGGLDFYGSEFPGFPPVGAVIPRQGKSTTPRSVAPRSVTTRNALLKRGIA